MKTKIVAGIILFAWIALSTWFQISLYRTNRNLLRTAGFLGNALYQAGIIVANESGDVTINPNLQR